MAINIGIWHKKVNLFFCERTERSGARTPAHANKSRTFPSFPFWEHDEPFASVIEFQLLIWYPCNIGSYDISWPIFLIFCVLLFILQMAPKEIQMEEVRAWWDFWIDLAFHFVQRSSSSLAEIKWHGQPWPLNDSRASFLALGIDRYCSLL